MVNHTTHSLLNRIYGRRDKSVIYKNNGTTTSLTTLNLHGAFYNHVDGIQYIQEKKGEFTVLIIKNALYSDKDDEFIKEHIGNAMGSREAVKIKYVDKLIVQSNGKFIPLISKIN